MAVITKKGTGWKYRVAYRDLQGVQHVKSKQGFRTKKDAMQAARLIELQVGDGANISKADIPLADYWHSWWTTYKQGKRTIATEKFYPIVEETIREQFGTMPIGKVTPELWQKFLNDYGKTHARSTSVKVNGYIRAMVRTAINDQVLHTDFTFTAEASGAKSKSEALKYLQLPQFFALTNLAYERADFNHLSTVAVYVGAQTGMRVAEVLGLTWDCVDEVNNQLTINKSWDHVHGTGMIPTKNESSNRVIEVLPEVIELLQNIHKQQVDWIRKSGVANAYNGVFFSKQSGILTGAAVNKVLKKMESAVKIPEKKQITFHGLRHTHVSYLLSSGVDIYYISKRLGHAGIQITMSTYSHLLDAQRTAQTEKAMLALSKIGSQKVHNFAKTGRIEQN
ncbi:site-specific integrase [Lacticaseibacillus sharpeae]|nr:site-specific integrase [Lacticaseibacillus sharpeae]